VPEEKQPFCYRPLAVIQSLRDSGACDGPTCLLP
jgi:hypothetical protein